MKSKGTNIPENKSSGSTRLAGSALLYESRGEDLQKSLKEITDYKYALDESSIVAITDQKGIINHVNDNFCNISKYSRAELLGQDHRIINSGYHSEEFIRDLWVTIAQGKIWRGELKNRAKDGTFYWVDTTIVPFLDDYKKPYQYIAIRADITSRKKLEEEQVFIASIVNYSDDAIISNTLDDVLTSWNHGAEKVFGYAAAEIIGKHINTLIPPHLWSQENEVMENIRKGKAIKDYEALRLRKDGTLIHVSLTISPLKDSQGNITGASRIVRDITKQKQAEQQLSNTLKEISDYKFALDESSIVAITDQKGIIQHANDNFCKISRYSREELIGQDHRIINSGNHSKDFIKNLWETIAFGKIWKGELKNKAKDGTVYWVDTTIVPFLNEKGKPYQYIAIRADITERKLAEVNLKQSLKETADYKYALDESSIVAITDQKGIIQYANDNFCKISRYSREELIGQDHRIINAAYHSKEFIKLLWITIANGKIWKGEMKNKAKDGSVYWVDTTIVPFLDENKKPYQYVAIRADITERKIAEEKLIESEKQYRLLFENNPMPMWVIDLTTFKFLDANKMALLQYGYSRQEFLAMTAMDIRPEEDKTLFMQSDHSYNMHDSNYNKGIWRHLKKDGSIIQVEIIAHEILFEGARARLILAHDVTEQKQAEQEVQKLNEELEQKVINRTEQLRKTNEELEAFSYSVSHDLRAPLRAIIGFSSILQEDYIDKLDDEAKRITGVIINNTKKMGQLIDDLLTFSRMGRMEVLKSKIDTDEMVKEVIAEMDLKEPNVKKINWVIHALPAIMGDINILKQVWINLISNAVKYSAKETVQTIEIGTCMHEEQIAFFIKDNGIGFDEKYKSKLFKVFQRLHSTEEFDGTGIGLAIVEKVISKHGGKVWAQGEVGKGASFYFSLPA